MTIFEDDRRIENSITKSVSLDALSGPTEQVIVRLAEGADAFYEYCKEKFGDRFVGLNFDYSVEYTWDGYSPLRMVAQVYESDKAYNWRRTRQQEEEREERALYEQLKRKYGNG